MKRSPVPVTELTRWRLAHRQRGIYAIEFALAFLLFFLVVYATLAYGVVFTVRQSLQYAAEEGARAGLRYPNVAAAQQLAARKSAALAVAAEKSWLPATVASANICPRDVDCGPATERCAPGQDTVCQIVVTVRYDYGAAPLLPSLPGMGLLLPAMLTGKAGMLLGVQALSL